MTMPMVGQRVLPDPTLAIAPNAAAQPGIPATPHDGEATAATRFGAVLTLLLEHVGMAAPAARAAGASVDGESVDDETVDGNETVDASTVPTPVLLGHALPAAASPVDAVADATLEDAARTTLAAALASSNAAAAAATAAAATAAAAAPPIAVTADSVVAADARTVRREMDLLVPEFRDRLARVIDRMESEFGYKVEISETYRTQARQDALYAQGRTEPGQVVTWTRASNHTAGRAADLVIDGSFDEALPYERLVRIAREEGLRTLGARDPGHVELSVSGSAAIARGSAEDLSLSAPDARGSIIARSTPSVASLSSIVPIAPELESTAPTSRASQAAAPIALAESQGVASVARVAPVAQVASVAQVAQIAVVGAQVTPSVHAPAVRGRSADSPAPRSAGPRRAATAAPVATSATATAPLSPSSPILGRELDAALRGENTREDGAGPAGTPNDDRRTRPRIDRATANESAAEIMRQSRDELVRAVAGVDPASTSTSPLASGDGSSGIAHADMSERIARLLKVQDAAADRPMSQMMLRLERPDGGEDRLRVDLRGNSVNATLDVGDQGVADRMGANVKELQQVLERHGFEADSITVRTVARSQESAALTRAAGASLESDLQRTVSTPSNASTNTSSRERGTRHDEQRPSPDSQRQRSRREQKGDR